MVVGESAGGGERSEHSLRQTSAVCGDHNPKLKEFFLFGPAEEAPIRVALICTSGIRTLLNKSCERFAEKCARHWAGGSGR